MAKIYSEKDHEIHWDDPGMFLKVEESFWELNEFLANKYKLDGHMAEIQWYMAVWQKMNEMLELYAKNPRQSDPLTDKEIL